MVSKVQRAMDFLEYKIDPPTLVPDDITKIILKTMVKAECKERTAWNAWRRLREKWQKNAREVRLVQKIFRYLQYYQDLIEDLFLNPGLDGKMRSLTAVEVRKINEVEEKLKAWRGEIEDAD